MRFLSAVIVALLLGTPAVAGDKRTHAEIAQLVISAVQAGESVNKLGLPLSVDDDESARIERLRGCSPSVGKGSSTSLIYVVWDCHLAAVSDDLTDTDKPVLELHFDGDRLTRLWLNPLMSERKPTAAALMSEDLPMTTVIAHRFTEAVTNEGDYSVGGLVPVIGAQRNRLRELKGCKPDRMSASTRLRQIFLWRCKGQSTDGSTLIEIHFDEKGRPLGLEFGTAITRPSF